MPNIDQTGAAATCIYCLRPGALFSRDHVIPEAFGTFKNNFVLKCVCHDCNQYFGKHLELTLARDSGEGVLRFRYGMRPAERARNLKRIRIKLTVHEPGPWMGAQAVLAPDAAGNGLEPHPLPQVAFNKGGTEWVWIQEEDLNAGSLAPHKGADMRVVAASREEQTNLIERLQALGFPFRKQGDLAAPLAPDGTILTKLTYQIDQIILRAIGKIAFNYVAYTQSAAFVLSSDFDEFRTWVRYGTEPQFNPRVVPLQQPILFLDSRKWRQTPGHLVTFDWNNQGQGLLAQVSLFNSLTYRGLLCLHYSGIWQEFRIGHHFDIESRTISRLGAVPLRRLSLPARP